MVVSLVRREETGRLSEVEVRDCVAVTVEEGKEGTPENGPHVEDSPPVS